MKISKLIDLLLRATKEHGDLDITFDGGVMTFTGEYEIDFHGGEKVVILDDEMH